MTADPVAEIDRAFVRLAEGLVHYRHVPATEDTAAMTPVYALHSSPVSSRSLAGLISLLGRSRRGIVPFQPRVQTPRETLTARRAEAISEFLDA